MVGFIGVWEAKTGGKQRSRKAEKQRGKETEKQRSKEAGETQKKHGNKRPKTYPRKQKTHNSPEKCNPSLITTITGWNEPVLTIINLPALTTVLATSVSHQYEQLSLVSSIIDSH